MGELQQPIICGGVRVFPKDIVIADEEGIAVVPHRKAEAVLKIARERTDIDATQSLAEWESAHHAKIEKLLLEKGFVEPS